MNVPGWAKKLNWVDGDIPDSIHLLPNSDVPPITVLTKDGEFYVAGVINIAGGTCNCCSATDYDPVVKYAFIPLPQ